MAQSSAAGSGTNDHDSFSSTQCEECLPGTFQSRVGETQCEVCPEGQSSDNGSRTCQPATALECVVRDCPADLTGDGFVSTDDLLTVLAVFGRVDCTYEIVINANLVGRIDTEDLLALLGAFGRAC